MPIVDHMLTVGCVAHIGALHGGTFEVLSGAHAGQSFPYNSNDEVQELGPEGDLRQVRMLRLTDAAPLFTVPTAIRHPDHLDRRKCRAPVEITDLTATILELAGVAPESALAKPWPAFHDRVPCRSLLPIVTGASDSVRDFSFGECNGLWQAIQDSRYKYVRFLDRRADGRRINGESSELLFDLESDPEELHDLLASGSGEASVPMSGEVRRALELARSRREWVNDTTPPAPTRWAPLPEGGERYSYP